MNGDGDEVAPRLPGGSPHDRQDNALSEPQSFGAGDAAPSWSRNDVQRPALRLRLLIDCRTAFADVEVLQTMTLIERLQADPEGPWADLSPVRLAALLREYGIGSAEIRFPAPVGCVKGYRRVDFRDAWERYLSVHDGTVGPYQGGLPVAQVEDRPSWRPVKQGAGAFTRVTVNLTPKTLEAIDTICRSTGGNRTECLNRGVQIFAWIQGHLDAGDKVCVIDREGHATQIRVF